MKHFRMMLLVGAVGLLGMMAFLNVHVHLSFARNDAHAHTSGTPVAPSGLPVLPDIVPGPDGEPQLRGAEGRTLMPAAPHAVPAPAPAPAVTPLPPVAAPVFASPAPVPPTPAQAPAKPAATGGFVSVADLVVPAPVAAAAPGQPAAPITAAPAAARAPAAAAKPAAPEPRDRLPEGAVPPGVPRSLKEQTAMKKVLDKEQRGALYDYCKDQQDTVVFFTYANFNGSDDKFCRFLESAAQNRIDMTVLNWGGEHRGNGNKLVFTRKAIATMNPCDVLIFSDAFDVLYAENAEEIRKKYMSINAPIIVSAECGCWPFIAHKNGDDICLNQFPKSPTDYRYINSGMWGARAYAAEDLLRRIMERNSLKMVQKMSDQEQISTLLLKKDYEWHKDIKIDYYASMFLNMHMADDYGRCDPEKDVVFHKGELYNKRTKFVPSMYHFNGGSKKRMADAEASMWYKQDRPIRPALTFKEVMDTEMTAADRNMNLKPIRVRDMCPSFSGKLLLTPPRPNYFKLHSM